jgi:hypothetical protein
MSVGRYALLLLALVTGSVAVAWPLLLSRLSAGERAAAGAGMLIAVTNALVAYALVHWSERRSNRLFFRAVLGGMLGRMTFMLAAVLGSVRLLRLPLLPLVFALLGYFTAFLALEVAIVSRRRIASPAA